MFLDPWDTERRPPCWPKGEQCPNSCARNHYEHVVHNHVELTGPWSGWRLAGRELVSPGPSKKALRITPRRLLGLFWTEAARERAAAAKAGSSQRDNVVPLQRDRTR
jgi:hypothetical protein